MFTEQANERAMSLLHQFGQMVTYTWERFETELKECRTQVVRFTEKGMNAQLSPTELERFERVYRTMMLGDAIVAFRDEVAQVMEARLTQIFAPDLPGVMQLHAAMKRAMEQIEALDEDQELSLDEGKT